MKIFPTGFSYKLPRDGAPEFVKGSISINVIEFTKFLQEHGSNGWVNLDFLKSKEGKLYFALNEWKPEKETIIPETKSEVIPF